MKFLVIDIECILDGRIWIPPEPDEPASFDARNGDGSLVLEGWISPPVKYVFPPPFAWRPISIGCALFELIEGAPRIVRLGAIDATNWSESPHDEVEATILKTFSGYIGKQAPDLVTWNGRAFDLPVLMLRSMRYGISHPWFYKSRDMRYRYSENGHCDLMDAMSEYGATQRPHLDQMAKLIGLPGKFGQIDGSSVGEAFAAGHYAEISNYCLSDVVQTSFLWLRWLLLTGSMSLEHYRESANGLLAHCSQGEHLQDFVERIDRKVLLLEKP